jgi:hypothetical protein
MAYRPSRDIPSVARIPEWACQPPSVGSPLARHAGAYIGFGFGRMTRCRRRSVRIRKRKSTDVIHDHAPASPASRHTARRKSFPSYARRDDSCRSACQQAHHRGPHSCGKHNSLEPQASGKAIRSAWILPNTAWPHVPGRIRLSGRGAEFQSDRPCGTRVRARSGHHHNRARDAQAHLPSAIHHPEQYILII